MQTLILPKVAERVKEGSRITGKNHGKEPFTPNSGKLGIVPPLSALEAEEGNQVGCTCFEHEKEFGGEVAKDRNAVNIHPAVKKGGTALDTIAKTAQAAVMICG